MTFTVAIRTAPIRGLRLFTIHTGARKFRQFFMYVILEFCRSKILYVFLEPRSASSERF